MNDKVVAEVKLPTQEIYIGSSPRVCQFGTRTMLIGEYKTYVLESVGSGWAWVEVPLPFENKK